MEDLSAKEIYEKNRKEKTSDANRAKRIKMLKKFSVWLLIILSLISGVYWLVKKRAKIAPKTYAVFYKTQSRDHINIGQSHPAYNSIPPTSGWHYENPAEKGVYKKELADEQLIHNLEHGYIWISYRSDASPKIIEQLENFYGFGKKIVVEPRKENDKLIAIAAWNWLDKFDLVSNNSLNDAELKRIGDFIDKYINQGPEPNAP